MIHVSYITQIGGKPGAFNGGGYLLVILSRESYSEHPGKFAVRGASVRKYFPQDFRIAVRSEKPGVRDVEIPVRFHYLLEIVIVISVGDEFDRSGGHCLELFLDKRGYGYDGVCIVKNRFFQYPVALFRPAAEAQMLEIEHFGPRITEIGYPRDPGGESCFPGYQVHGVRGTCADNDVYRMLPEIFFQVFH